MNKSTRHGQGRKSPDTGQALDSQGEGQPKSPASGGVASLCKAVRSAKGAKKYLARLLQSYQKGLVTSENARTSVYVLSEFLKAWDVSNYQARLEAIEKRLNMASKYQISKP